MSSVLLKKNLKWAKRRYLPMNRIKELRIEKGLTQNQLASLLGINQTAAGKYERGELEPNLQNLIKLSHIFECSVDYIICNADDFGNVTVKNEKPVGLSDDELTLIEKYRRLQTGYQVLIGNQIQVLLDHQKKSELPAQQEYGSQKKTKQ